MRFLESLGVGNARLVCVRLIHGSCPQAPSLTARHTSSPSRLFTTTKSWLTSPTNLIIKTMASPVTENVLENFLKESGEGTSWAGLVKTEETQMHCHLPSIAQLLGWTSTFQRFKLVLDISNQTGMDEQIWTLTILFIHSETEDYPLKVIKSTLNDAFPLQQWNKTGKERKKCKKNSYRTQNPSHLCIFF